MPSLGGHAIAASTYRDPQVIYLLLARGEQTPDRVGYEFLHPDDAVEALTYGQLAARSLAFAETIQAACPDAGAGPALLLYPPGLDYVVALFGCFLRGLAVVPAYPPRAKASDAESERLRGIQRDSR